MTKATSIIVVLYHSDEVIKPCLDSIAKQDLRDYEVILVDNYASDRDRSGLMSRWPDLIFIENATNVGYAKAVNQGIDCSNGKFALCLNDDVTLEPGFLSHMLKAIKTDNKIASIQPKVLKSDGKHIDSIGIFLSGLRRFYDIGSGCLDGTDFDKERLVFGACASAVLYRREALEDIKEGAEYFDEDFFCVAEDVDLSWRMQNRGWKAMYSPDARCVHAGGISRKNSRLLRYYSFRNRYFMMLKNEPPSALLKFLAIFLIYDLWRNLYMMVVSPGYFLKAFYEVMRTAPKMLRKRAQKEHQGEIIR
jgi:GT2 family glycosyltransferase